MHSTLKAIVLGTVRHSDRVNIVSLYTDTLGRISVVAPASGTSRAARLRRAALMPLSVIETDINIHPTRELQSLGRTSLLRPNNGIAGHPLKSALALFAADFLSHLLRDADADPMLWRAIVRGIEALNRCPNPANWHITFLSQLTTPLGIRPDVSGCDGDSVFDMREGRYVRFTPTHRDVLTDDEADAPRLLSRLNYDNFHRLRLTRTRRQRMLDGLLKYYAIHIPGVSMEKSLQVLRALFD